MPLSRDHGSKALDQTIPSDHSVAYDGHWGDGMYTIIRKFNLALDRQTVVMPKKPHSGVTLCIGMVCTLNSILLLAVRQ